MRINPGSCATFILANIFCLATFAQTTTISGNVKNSATNESVSAVSITVKGSGSGTFTDDKGNFKFTTTRQPPLTLVISSIGYTLQEIEVSNASDFVQVNNP